MVVEAVQVATLQVGEVAILVEVGEAEVVAEVSQGGNPLEEVVSHLEMKGCWAQHQKYSMEAGRIFTASYSHSVSIGR